MTTAVLICDDSGVARKQMARTLPADWDVQITYAEDGEQGLAAIRQGLGEVIFLDLNMPVLDGYGVLSRMQQEELPGLVIVVSGDIQPEAQARVTQAGAIAFIKKPIDTSALTKLLRDYGLYVEASSLPVAPRANPVREQGTILSEIDCYQEIANVAMGQAADLLARLLGVFIKLPVPRVNLLELTELQMALQLTQEPDARSVCQGFIGGGIAGEALLIFHEASMADMARLMKYNGELTETVQRELVMDVASVLIGACTKGIAEQMDLSFSQGHPVVLGQHMRVADLMQTNAWRWKRTLAVEISYSVEGYDIACDLLLLFTEDSMASLRTKVAYLLT